MKWGKVFILVACIYCCVYISNGVVTRGYIHFVFKIFIFREHVTTGGTGHTLACSPFVGQFGDAVMYNGALI